MFLFKKPDDEMIRRFLDSQRESSYTYSEIGATKDSQKPRGYDHDHNRIQIGKGREDFLRAKAAIRSWKMFDFPWSKLCFETTPIEAGQTVAARFNHFGFWSLNAARIVYTLEETGEVEKFGFAYGTLQDHVETGEERFSVEFRAEDESVWYDIYAFSKPRHVFARLGYPVSRYLQRSFVTESKKAMIRAVKFAKTP